MSILKNSLLIAAVTLPLIAEAESVATVAQGVNVVGSHPWGGVKEQTSRLYAQQLALKGFITLAFDASHYGESGDEPRNLEDPADRAQDINRAEGYLASLPQVDENCIGTIGKCIGGGYTLHEAQTDLRVKTVAGIVTYDIVDANRHGIEGAPVSTEDRLKLLQDVDKQLNKEAAGRPILIQQLLPSRNTLTAKTSNFVREATKYYLTTRGTQPNAKNLYVVTSPGLHMAYYLLEYMELIAPRPVLLIAGEWAETLRFSQVAYNRAQHTKQMLIIPDASYFDLYDKSQYVKTAVNKLAKFFSKYL